MNNKINNVTYKNTGKYISRLGIRDKIIHVGIFDSIEEAYRAMKKEGKKYGLKFH